MKICTQCGETKDLTDFGKSYLKKKDGTQRGNGIRGNCKSCENKRRMKSYRSHIETRLMMNSKARAKKTGLEHTLIYEDIIIPEICPILKIPFIIGKKGDYDFTPTIDRLDSTKGYTKDNIKIISMLANKMKNSANREQLLTFAKTIVDYIK